MRRAYSRLGRGVIVFLGFTVLLACSVVHAQNRYMKVFNTKTEMAASNPNDIATNCFIADGSGIFVYWKNSTATPDGTSVVLPSSGVGRWLVTAGGDSPIINVKAGPYYARGDGTTDDTVPLQSAINAGSSSHKLVFLPPGWYRTTATLWVTNNTTIIGEGMGISVITNSVLTEVCTFAHRLDLPPNPPTNWYRCDWPISNVTFKDFSVYGANTPHDEEAHHELPGWLTTTRLAQTHFWLIGVTDLRLERVEGRGTQFGTFTGWQLTNAVFDGCVFGNQTNPTCEQYAEILIQDEVSYIDVNGYSTNITIRNCTIENTGTKGITLGHRTYDADISHNLLRNTTHMGIQPGENTSVSFNKVMHMVTNLVNHSVAGINVEGVRNVRVVGNTVEDSQMDGINADGDPARAIPNYVSDNVVLANNTVRGCYYFGMRLVGGWRWVVTGNMVYSNDLAGVIAFDCKDLMIANNTIQDNGLNVHPPYTGYALYVADVGVFGPLTDHAVIEHNTLGNFTSALARFGVYVSPDVTNVVTRDNDTSSVLGTPELVFNDYGNGNLMLGPGTNIVRERDGKMTLYNVASSGGGSGGGVPWGGVVKKPATAQGEGWMVKGKLQQVAAARLPGLIGTGDFSIWSRFRMPAAAGAGTGNHLLLWTGLDPGNLAAKTIQLYYSSAEDLDALFWGDDLSSYRLVAIRSVRSMFEGEVVDFTMTRSGTNMLFYVNEVPWTNVTVSISGSSPPDWDATLTHSVASATRSRLTGVATITTATPHQLADGNYVTLSGFGGAGYNVSDVAVTVAGPSTFSIVNAGGDEGSTPDVGGTISASRQYLSIGHNYGSGLTGNPVVYYKGAAFGVALSSNDISEVIVSDIPMRLRGAADLLANVDFSGASGNALIDRSQNNDTVSLLGNGDWDFARRVLANGIGYYHTPASSAETNYVGAVCYDDSNIYIWTATGTNKKIPLTPW